MKNSNNPEFEIIIKVIGNLRELKRPNFESLRLQLIADMIEDMDKLANLCEQKNL